MQRTGPVVEYVWWVETVARGVARQLQDGATQVSYRVHLLVLILIAF